jgi:hypothetical protein
MGVTCSKHGEKRNAFKIVVSKSKGKIPTGRTKPRWENNIKVDLNDLGWRVLEIGLRVGTSGELL